MKRPILKILIAVSVAAACSQISPAGLIAAAQLDPLETPPADISVAVAVPRNIRLRSGDAALYLGYQPDDGAAVAVTVPLSRRKTQVAPSPLRADQSVYVFGFAPDAAALLAQTQAQIRNLKAAGVDGIGTLSILIKSGCYTGKLDDVLLATTWLKTRPDAAFTQMTRATDLYDMLDAASGDAIRSGLVPC